MRIGRFNITKVKTDKIDLSKKGLEYRGSDRVRLEVDGANGFTLGAFEDYMNVIWGYYSDRNLINIYDAIPEVFAPIHHIAFRVANANWQVKKVKDDEVVYDNKWLNKLLSTPNPLQNFQELIYQLVTYKYVTGKNFLYANIPDTLTFDYKNVATLLNLFADQVTIVNEWPIKLLSATEISDIIKSYNVNDGQGLTIISPEKVLYLQFHSLRIEDMKIKGRSPLLAAQKPFVNLIKVYEARNVIYTKCGALGLLVSKKSDASGMVSLTPDEKKETLEEWNSSYGISKWKSPIAMTTAPIDFIKIAMSISELQPFDETLADALAIYGVLNVPRSLLPQPKGSTFDNTNQEEKSFYENVIIPTAQSIAQSLTNFLKLNDAGYYLEANFDHVKVLQENLKEKAAVDWRNNETSRVQFERGLITLNDWCRKANVEPSTNTLYDKRMFEMTLEEQAQVVAVISIAIGSNSGTINNSDADAGN